MRFTSKDEVTVEDVETTVIHKHRFPHRKMARRVVVELASQIPMMDDQYSPRREMWNCGYDCIHFVPAEEREDSDRPLCKGRDCYRDPIIDKQKRCPFKEVHEGLKVVPKMVNEFSVEDEEEEDDLRVPKKPKRW